MLFSQFYTDSFHVAVCTQGGGGYSHILGIYGGAAHLGGFVKRFAPMMGAFLPLPADGFLHCRLHIRNDFLTELGSWVFMQSGVLGSKEPTKLSL